MVFWLAFSRYRNTVCFLRHSKFIELFTEYDVLSRVAMHMIHIAWGSRDYVHGAFLSGNAFGAKLLNTVNSGICY